MATPVPGTSRLNRPVANACKMSDMTQKALLRAAGEKSRATTTHNAVRLGSQPGASGLNARKASVRWTEVDDVRLQGFVDGEAFRDATTGRTDWTALAAQFSNRTINAVKARVYEIRKRQEAQRREVVVEKGSEPEREVEVDDQDTRDSAVQDCTSRGSVPSGFLNAFARALVAVRTGKRPALPGPMATEVASSMLPHAEILIQDAVARFERRTKTKVSFRHFCQIVKATAHAIADWRKAEAAEAWQAKATKQERERMIRLRKEIGRMTSEVAARESNGRGGKKRENFQKYLRINNIADTRSLKAKLVELKLALVKSKAKIRLLCEYHEVRKTRSGYRGGSANQPHRGETGVQDPDVTAKYWKSIFGTPAGFRPGELIHSWRDEVGHPPAESTDILADLDEVLRKVAPWKAPGPDGVHGWWWKHSPLCRTRLVRYLKEEILPCTVRGSGRIERWWPTGRTVLIPKLDNATKPSDFRPIACLNTSYKIFTGCLARVIEKEIGTGPKTAFAPEQRALKRGERACLHAHFVDHVTTIASRVTTTPCAVGWIDFAKAFDSISHDYLKWLLRAAGVSTEVLVLVSRLMSRWKTVIGKGTGAREIRVRSGVFQGDSLSPLLFCLCVSPISYALREKCDHVGVIVKAGKGEEERVNHMFYVDDLKIYSGSVELVLEVIKKVEQLAETFGLKLNASKSAVRSIYPRSEMEETPSSCIPIHRDLDTYKYLGIYQGAGTHTGKVLSQTREAISKRVSGLCMARLTAGQIRSGIKTTIGPLVEYVFSCGAIGSRGATPFAVAEQLNVTLRKALAAGKFRFAHGNTARLYTCVERGGVGLIDLRIPCSCGIAAAVSYAWFNPSLATLFKRMQILDRSGKRTRLAEFRTLQDLLGFNAKFQFGSITVICVGKIVQCTTASQLTRFVRLRAEEVFSREWERGAPGGELERNGVDVAESFRFMREARLSPTNLRNVMAVQEYSFLKAAGYKGSSCRACGKRMSIVHLVAGCDKWLSGLYLDRHNSVLRHIFNVIVTRHGHAGLHFTESIPSQLRIGNCEIVGDVKFPTFSQELYHRRPDLVVIMRSAKGTPEKVLVVDACVPHHSNLRHQLELKRTRYMQNGVRQANENAIPEHPGPNLGYDLQKMYRCEVDFLAVVVGTCGEIPVGLAADLQQKLCLSLREVETLLERLSVSAAMGTSRVCRAFMALKRNEEGGN